MAERAYLQGPDGILPCDKREKLVTFLNQEEQKKTKQQQR